MPTSDEIRASIVVRLDQCRAEVADLELVLAAFDSPPTNGGAPTPAPYGYKRDGTPRKRPAPAPATQRKAAATRNARRNGVGGTAVAGPPVGGTTDAAGTPPAVVLHVQTMTTPERELEGRTVAWTTQAPAMAEVA